MAAETRSAELARTEDDIAIARERLVLSIQALRHEVVRRKERFQEEIARSTDWREWVRRRPGTFVAAAFAVGFLIGRRR